MKLVEHWMSLMADTNSESIFIAVLIAVNPFLLATYEERIKSYSSLLLAPHEFIEVSEHWNAKF